jgi:hypothetical protein
VYDYARLYGEFLNDMLKLTVGATTGGVWGSGGKADKGFDDIRGINVEVKPIERLDVGFQLRTEPDGNMPAEQWLKETVIGAKYEMAGLFSAVGALSLGSDYKGPKSWDPSDNDKGDPDGKQMRALFGVNVKAVPNLEAILDGYVLGLGDLTKYGVAAIGQRVGYQITPELKVTLDVLEKLNLRGDDYKNKDLSTFRLEAEPKVNYKLSDLSYARSY